MTMICPWEHCTARRDPIEQQLAPNSDRRVEVFPVHSVEGPASWFGTCPASHLIVPTLTEAGRGVLAEATRHYESMLRDRPAPAARPPRPVGEQQTVLRRDANGWFTAPGSDPRKTPPQHGRPHLELIPELKPVPTEGTNVSDALRDQLRALALLAVESLQQVQNQTAAASHELDNLVTATITAADNLTAGLRELSEKAQAAQQLAAAAVGADNPPQPAVDMTEAASGLDEHISGSIALMSVLRTAVYEAAAGTNEQLADVLRLAGVAGTAGEEYVRSI